MKLNKRRHQQRLTTLALAGAVLLAAGCAGGESTQHGTPKPDPDMVHRQEEARRDRERSREEMTELVRDIEDLNRKADAVWSEYADLQGEAAARAHKAWGGESEHSGSVSENDDERPPA